MNTQKPSAKQSSFSPGLSLSFYIRRPSLRHPLRTIFLLLIIGALLAACGNTTTTTSSSPTAVPSPTAQPVTLNVFAAASLTESFTEIATQYQAKNPSVTIKYNFAGSQLLEQQLANGAAADVFASAALANMQKTSTAGLGGSSQILAKNRLIV